LTRLYQRLRERATFFHAKSSGWGRQGTVRTEITLEQYERTLLVCGHGSPEGTSCPLCGQVLPTTGLEQQPYPLRPERILPANESTDPKHPGLLESKSNPRRFW
jgi:hypothetical protein